jgi:hypothetical protein
MIMSSWLTVAERFLYELALAWKLIVGDDVQQKAYNWPAEDCAPVVVACTAFAGAYEACMSDRSPGTIHLKNDAKKTFKQSIMRFADEHVRHNRKIPHDTLMKLGIVPDDETKKSKNLPTEGPTSKVILNGQKPAVIGIRYIGPKPDPRCICCIRWSFDEVAPATAQLMQKWDEDIFSRNPWEKVFPDKRGKMFHYSLCWKLPNGWSSEWSPVISVSVP